MPGNPYGPWHRDIVTEHRRVGDELDGVPQAYSADPRFNFAGEVDHAEDFQSAPRPVKTAVEIASSKARSIAKSPISSS